MSTEEATINPDGSASFQDAPPPSMDEGADQGESFYQDGSQALPEDEGGIDPAFYLLGAVVLVVAVYFLLLRKKEDDEGDDFFSELDGEKFNFKLPTEVDEYYQVKAKCENAGWEPGNPPKNPKDAQAAGPHRMLAQALMKRAMADIPMVQQIQQESAGMNKLYAQSMCSVKQWQSYQRAEALVSQEVEEVRVEADEIEPGWSQAIWRQAMQYHQMLKKKHEMEEKQREEAAQKRKQIEKNVAEAKSTQSVAEQEKAAEEAAAELLRQEEAEQKKKSGSSNGGSGTGMKKGFLQAKGKKK